MEDLRKMMNGLKPVVLMVMVQIAFASVNVLYKLAANDGMSMRIATAYRLLFASVSTLPLALVFERNKRPKITQRVLFMAFLCGLFGGSLFQNIYFEALALTSATFVSAIYNLIPVITFILAISCGFERLNLGAAGGKAKVLGTIIGIGGAMLLTFFKGFEIQIWSFHVNPLHPHHDQNDTVLTTRHGRSELLGVLCAIASCFSNACWLIIQAKMSAEYPCHLSTTFLIYTMGAIQAIVFALCMERDWNQWKLGWNVRLLAVLIAGIIASGMLVVMAWCVRMRGPVFASAFTPLMLVIVALAASLTLNEKLYLGSVIGALLIVCGLYFVLWGKRRDVRTMPQSLPSETTQQEIA
ncbi:WAT1-related protein At1g25270-like [Prosopis cineraria]|uniref:WAT1-related protein At1g25270-like n=1 Tax=Prosopis cineraria TaxID=364024 RepID=UPI00240EF239|nr:WAT1-related protein At1g25270-like [Prosopis cineraria]